MALGCRRRRPGVVDDDFADFEDGVEDIFEDAEEGELEEFEIGELELAADGISASAVAEIAFGAAGLVLGVGLTLYGLYQDNEDRLDIMEKIEHTNDNYEAMLRAYEQMLNIKITTPVISTTLTNYRTSVWASRDCFGSSVKILDVFAMTS